MLSQPVDVDFMLQTVVDAPRRSYDGRSRAKIEAKFNMAVDEGQNEKV